MAFEIKPGEELSVWDQQPCAAMFGSCGDDMHREEVLEPRYAAEGIRSYNPKVAPGTWDPSMADVEADHLAADTVQTWPITDATYGLKSLGEQGWAAAASLDSESPYPHFVVAMIDKELAPELDDPGLRKESLEARRLMAEHMSHSKSPNLFVVESLEEMADASVKLYRASEILVELTREHNPAFKKWAEGRKVSDRFRLALESGQLGIGAAEISRLD